jgi:hypothetical protein
VLRTDPAIFLTVDENKKLIPRPAAVHGGGAVSKWGQKTLKLLYKLCYKKL